MKKRILFISFIFLTIILAHSIVHSKEIWHLELLEKVPYNDISSKFIGIGYEFSCISDSVITSFVYGQQYFFNLEKLQFKSFGTTGMGPGEFKRVSNMIAIKNNKYCVDESKMSMMIFNAQNKFIKEIKLDFAPISIFKLSDNKLGIAHHIYNFNEKLINVYSLDGTFIGKIVFLQKNNLYGYKDIRAINFFYDGAQFFQREDWIYIFLGPIPLIHKYNLKTNQNEFIDYKKQLPFKPTKPFIAFKKEESQLFSKFHLLLVQEHKDYLIFKALTGKNIKQMEFQLVKFNFINDSLEIIEIVNKKFKIDFNTLAIYGNKLYKFDESKEILSIYQIQVKAEK